MRLLTPAFLLATALGLAGCGGEPARPAGASALPAATVTTAAVEAISRIRLEPLAGTVRPADHALVSARVTGAVIGPVPALGTRVAAGQTVLTLNADEVRARLAQARAVLDQVERELARERTLLTGGASTAENVRLLEDRRRASAAAVDEAATLAGYTTVTAPFAGVVTRRLVETGDLATAGSPLFELEGTDRLRAEVAVPESLAAPAPGAELTVTADGSRISARLAEISPAADPATRTRLAKVDLPAGAAVRSGQFVRVLWPASRAEVLLVPAGALVRFGQMEQVFVAESGRARLRLVRTGGTEDGRTVILSGLAAGETVVANPTPTLRDGQALEVRP
jgi:RND family efflux transporter MFP subunit